MINDIYHCVQQARDLQANLEHNGARDQELVRVFTSVARDESVGLMAYAIWRGRAKLLSRLREHGPIRYDGAAGARHAQS